VPVMAVAGRVSWEIGRFLGEQLTQHLRDWDPNTECGAHAVYIPKKSSIMVALLLSKESSCRSNLLLAGQGNNVIKLGSQSALGALASLTTSYAPIFSYVRPLPSILKT